MPQYRHTFTIGMTVVNDDPDPDNIPNEELQCRFAERAADASGDEWTWVKTEEE